jgi:hypothetical protein
VVLRLLDKMTLVMIFCGLTGNPWDPALVENHCCRRSRLNRVWETEISFGNCPLYPNDDNVTSTWVWRRSVNNLWTLFLLNVFIVIQRLAENVCSVSVYNLHHHGLAFKSLRYCWHVFWPQSATESLQRSSPLVCSLEGVCLSVCILLTCWIQLFSYIDVLSSRRHHHHHPVHPKCTISGNVNFIYLMLHVRSSSRHHFCNF